MARHGREWQGTARLGVARRLGDRQPSGFKAPTPTQGAVWLGLALVWLGGAWRAKAWSNTSD